MAELLSVRALAHFLGVSAVTVRRLLKRRLLAHSRVGRKIVIDARDVEQFIADRRVEAKVKR